MDVLESDAAIIFSVWCFNYRVDVSTVVLGFGDRKAIWHHGGTDPYTITPVRAKALAFGGIVRKRVHHPGLPKRPLTGSPASDQKLAAEITRDHLAAVINGA